VPAQPGLIGRVVSGRASDVKMVGMVEMGASISLDGVAVHPDCWCICLCYLHFAPENTEDDEMYLLVLAHLGCPRQGPQSHKMVVVVFIFKCSGIKGGISKVMKSFIGRGSSNPVTNIGCIM